MTVELNTRSAAVKTAYQSAVPLISQVAAEAGVETSIESWSALRVAQAIAALAATPAQGALAATALQPSSINTLVKLNAIVADATLGDAGDFATAIQGAAADASLPRAGGTMTGNIVMAGAETVDGRDVSADGTKLDLISITQAVDLDAIETRVNALDAAVVLKGVWDAAVGTFPGGGAAQAGDSYIVSAGGTVGGVAFAVNDRVIAITDNASTTVFAANWFKADYSDAYQTDDEIKTAYQTAVPLISQADAEAGIATGIESWSALRVAQAIAALAGGGGAFTADVNTQITPSTAIVLDQATGNEIALDLSFTVNKLTSGNYTGLKLYATETSAPGTDDRLLDLGVGLLTKLKVGNDGSLWLNPATRTTGFSADGRDVTINGQTIRYGYSYAGAFEVGVGFVFAGSYVGLNPTTELGWGVNNGATRDTILVRDAAGILAQRNNANAQTSRIYGDYGGATDYQRCGIVTKRTATTVPAGASFTLTGFIPDGALLLGITSRVDTTCTTATGYTVGDGVDADLWGVAAAVAVGTATGSADFTAAGASGVFYSAAQDVVVTATGGSFDGTGVITVCAHYLITEAD